MNKGEFIAAYAEKMGSKKAEAERAFNAFVEVVESTLKDGEKVQLVGFGVFELKARDAKEGINPATGEKIQIKACKVPSFKAHKLFKERFN